MNVSHLNQNLKIVKGIRSLKDAFEGVGGGHLCPYGRKLIGSLVLVHSRSVPSNTCAFLGPSLKLVAFLLNYFTCFPIHNMIVLKDVVCYG